MIGSIDGEMINTAKELIAALQKAVSDAAKSNRDWNKGVLTQWPTVVRTHPSFRNTFGNFHGKAKRSRSASYFS